MSLPTKRSSIKSEIKDINYPDQKVKKTTLPIMSIYEKTALLAKRARAIADGSPITVKITENLSPYDIAKKELYAKTIPYKIIRIFPNGEEEVWGVKELRIIE